MEVQKWSTIFYCAQVGNALEELSGKEVKVGSDPTCSRILEALIPRIDHEHLLLLLTALSQGEEFCQLSSRCAVLVFMSMSEIHPLSCKDSLDGHLKRCKLTSSLNLYMSLCRSPTSSVSIDALVLMQRCGPGCPVMCHVLALLDHKRQSMTSLINSTMKN